MVGPEVNDRQRRLDWLSAVYDLHGVRTYNLALHILGETSRAEDIVEQAFVAIAASTPPTVAIESVGQSISGAVCDLALAALRRRP